MFTVTYFKGKYKHYVGIACYVMYVQLKKNYTYTLSEKPSPIILYSKKILFEFLSLKLKILSCI